MLPAVVQCLVSLITIFVTHWVYRWRNPKCKNGILPPGSMGFPLIGETLELLMKPGRSLDIHPFIKKRIERYGPIFRTSIAGKQVVVSADPEMNHYLFLQEGKSVELWYMDTYSKFFGTEGSGKIDVFTARHRYVRNTTMNHFGGESLRGELIPEIEKHMHKTLSSWSEMNIVNLKPMSVKMVFDFISKRMFSYDAETHEENLSENIANLSQSYMTFPLNIPGTAFHDCLRKKEFIVKRLKEKLREKLDNPEANQEDMLDQVVKDMKIEKFITEDYAITLTFGVLFTASHSISTAITLAFQLLSDYPSIVDELRVEHDDVLGKRMSGKPLSWGEYKSMTFTLQVIDEILRLTSATPGALRRATKDVHLNGYTIPQGWTIMIASSALQLNSSTYKNPLAFNPHRWKELDPSVISKTFMPFGVGTRQCAGAEFTRVFMSIFFHVLCTKYRWTKKTGGNNISRKPYLDFGDGIGIGISKKV